MSVLLCALSYVVRADVPAVEGDCCAVPSRFAALVPAPDQEPLGDGQSASPEGMVWIPGGEFVMGSDLPDAYRVEQPAHRVKVSGFFIDETEVTNAQFRRFVEATGYVTTAEKAPTLAEIMAQLAPGTAPPPQEALVAASLVFTPPAHAVH